MIKYLPCEFEGELMMLKDDNKLKNTMKKYLNKISIHSREGGDLSGITVKLRDKLENRNIKVKVKKVLGNLDRYRIV